MQQCYERVRWLIDFMFNSYPCSVKVALRKMNGDMVILNYPRGSAFANLFCCHGLGLKLRGLASDDECRVKK